MKIDPKFIFSTNPLSTFRLTKDVDQALLYVQFAVIGMNPPQSWSVEFHEDGYGPWLATGGTGSSVNTFWFKYRLRASSTMRFLYPAAPETVITLMTQNGYLAVPALHDPEYGHFDAVWRTDPVTVESDGSNFLQLQPEDMRNPELVRLEQLVMRRAMEREGALLDEIRRLRDAR